jgi:hypothetical protein
MVGLIVGGAVGAFMGAVPGDFCSLDHCWVIYEGGHAWTGLAWGIALGAGIGVAAGATRRRSGIWRPVPLTGHSVTGPPLDREPGGEGSPGQGHSHDQRLEEDGDPVLAADTHVTRL